MAKGDHKRVQDAIYSGQRQQDSRQTRLDNALYGANDSFQNNYNRGSEMDFRDRDRIMNGYENFMNDPFGSFGSPSPSYRGNLLNSGPVRSTFSGGNGWGG